MSIETASFLGTGVYNLDSSRFGKAQLDERQEGWTESWGDQDLDETSSSHWKLDEEAVSSLLTTKHPQLAIVLMQFRPAWFEQLVLHMARIPHIVLNSNNISNEATGPLPYLRDHLPSKVPILVGRHHPSTADNFPETYANFQNSILNYLSTTKDIDLDSLLTDDRQRSLSKCYVTLICTEIQPLLKYLRFEDEDAWKQVYRGQYISASNPIRDNWISALKGRFQASVDRAVERRNLIDHSRRIRDTDVAVERIKEALQSLESQLLSHKGPHLLGNRYPSLVDALAWSTLAECLCDVHLVVVVADFPRLISYFKHIHSEYFSCAKDEDWKSWNKKQNMANAFNQLPTDRMNGKVNSNFKDAIDLMQTLSLQHEEIQQVLNASKSKRAREPWPFPGYPNDSAMYRWRMGADIFRRNKEATDAEDNPIRKKMIREQTRNDQRWISGVLAVSAVTVLILHNSARSAGGYANK